VLEVSFSSTPPGWIDRLRQLPAVESVTGDDHAVRVASNHGPTTTLALMEAASQAGVTIQSLSVQSTTLDDVFVHYAGRALRDALQEQSAAERSIMVRGGR
jgi:ABC-2 type transport system ATP-binding protein